MVTVVRTSLDRLAYQMVFPYLSIYIIALGATATQLGLVNSLGMLVAGLAGPFTGLAHRPARPQVLLPRRDRAAGRRLPDLRARAELGHHRSLAMMAYWLGYSISSHSCATICGNCLANQDRATGMTICETVAAGLLGIVGPIVGTVIVMRVRDRRRRRHPAAVLRRLRHHRRVLPVHPDPALGAAVGSARDGPGRVRRPRRRAAGGPAPQALARDRRDRAAPGRHGVRVLVGVRPRGQGRRRRRAGRAWRPPPRWAPSPWPSRWAGSPTGSGASGSCTRRSRSSRSPASCSSGPRGRSPSCSRGRSSPSTTSAARSRRRWSGSSCPPRTWADGSGSRGS